MRVRAGSPSRRQRGFTMIEVMVSILVTAIAIIGIVSLYMAESRASAYSRHTSEASVLAEDGMEKLRSLSVPVNSNLSAVDELGGGTGIFDRASTVTGPI